MATSRTNLKSYFQTGKKPTQIQFAEVIDNLIHREEDKIAATGTIDVSNDAKFITPKGVKNILDTYAVRQVNNVLPDDTGNVRITDLFVKNTPLRYWDFTKGHDAVWFDYTPMKFADGEVFKIKMAILIKDIKDYNLITQLDYVDELEPDIIRRFYVYYYINPENPNQIDLQPYLEEVKSYSYVKRTSFSTGWLDVSADWMNIEIEIKIIDNSKKAFECLISVNDIKYSLAAGTIEFSVEETNYSQLNYPQSNRICWNEYYPASIYMGYLTYEINGVKREFWMDSKYQIYATSGQMMEISPDNKNFIDISNGAKLFVRPVDNVLKQTELIELLPQTDTEWIDITYKLSKELSTPRATLHYQISGKEIVFKTGVLLYSTEHMPASLPLADLSGLIYQNTILQTAPLLVTDERATQALLVLDEKESLYIVLNPDLNYKTINIQPQIFRFFIVY